jgi:ABC-type antimicrobial peptide transport system permease subunit
VQWLVLRRGLGLALAGIAIGLAMSAGAGRAVRAMLFGVTPSDPITLATVAIVLAAAALVASWLPARQAARVDPTETLRMD